MQCLCRQEMVSDSLALELQEAVDTLLGYWAQELQPSRRAATARHH